MVKSTLNSELRTRIDTFVTELTSMVTQSALASVEEAFGGGPVRRGPGRPRGSGRRGRPPGRPAAATRAKRGKRSTEQVDAMGARVLAHVKANPGQRLEEIGRAMKVPTKGLKLPISKLLAAKKLKKSGEKRGTKYAAR